MKLAEWARANGVRPQAAYRWFREDRMLVPARRLEPGTIWVDAVPADEPGRVVVYARVSSRDQRQDPGETADDLVRDMTGVLTCMCARLYGRRGARNRACAR